MFISGFQNLAGNMKARNLKSLTMKNRPHEREIAYFYMKKISHK